MEMNCKIRKSTQGIILIPYADLENKNSGANINKTVERREIYLKNCCVALLSAKKYNLDSDVALVTNIKVPEYYRRLLSNNGILIFEEPFDEFFFDYEIKWALAFYKLCALSKIVKKYDYQYYSYLDSDVYISNSFETIWTECDEHIMLYDINHGLGTPNYKTFTLEWESFLGEKRLLTQYGGEFFAANKDNAMLFIDMCTNIFNEMVGRRFITTKGDEFIISLVAKDLKNKVKNAGAYIYRFWTGDFYLVSTCYKYNPVTILHLPTEKENGMLKIFNRYIKQGILPSNKKVWKICRLQHQSKKVRLKVFIKKLLRR